MSDQSIEVAARAMISEETVEAAAFAICRTGMEDCEQCSLETMRKWPCLTRARAALTASAALQPQAPDIEKEILGWSCDTQFELATLIAANVGYVLRPGPTMDESPALAAVQPQSGGGEVLGALKELADAAEHDMKMNQGGDNHEDEPEGSGGWWSTRTANAITAARAALTRASPAVIKNSDPHPRWKSGGQSDRHPQSIEEWNFQNDPLGGALERSLRRLNVATDYDDPRVPDQMALVLRIDILSLIHDWIQKKAAWEIWRKERGTTPAVERVPDGWQLVPKEPTPEMLAATLPIIGRHHDPLADRTAEQALFLLEGRRSDMGAETHRAGKTCALDLIGDYRAMLSAAPERATKPARSPSGKSEGGA